MAGRARALEGVEGKAMLREPEQQGVLSYILQGSVFIGVLLLLFVLAGFRG